MRIFFTRNFCLLIFFLIPLCAASQTRGLKFIPNKNQWPDHVQFSASFPGGTMNIGAGRFMYYFVDGEYLQEMHERSHQAEPDGRADSRLSVHAVQANFVNANLNAHAVTFGQSEEYFNYFIGNDPSRWASRVHSVAGMLYREFYRDIDLKVYSIGSNLKYDFVVAPGADPSQILIRYDGATSVSMQGNGDLVVTTAFGEMLEKKPVAYQYVDGKRAFVECEFVLLANKLSFRFPSGFDPCYELVIDPLLIFSTYSGSTADNWGSTATPGEHGKLYSSGVTNETRGGEYPVTTGVFQTESGGIYDIGILKYDSLGSNLLYSTYLGGSQSESPHSLVMDHNEDLIVLGTTGSADFPVTGGAFQTDFRGGEFVRHVVDYNFGCDIFLARISRDGDVLKASTFLGGEKNDGLNVSVVIGTLVKNYGDHLRGDVITDASGNIYVSSVTTSDDLPLVNGFETSYQGGDTDAVVLKMSPDLSTMIWGAFVGGIGVDAAHTIKLDSDGNIFIAGGTSSADFPIPEGAYLKTHFNGVDGWIAHVRNDGSGIMAGTYVGTPSFDQVYFLDLNDNDEPFVFGQTNSGIFPRTSGVYDDRPNSGQFIQKYNPGLTSLLISTAFGSGRGQPDISPTAFLVNDCNNLYLSGWGGGGAILNGRPEVQGWQTSTNGLYVTNDAMQKTTSGNDFYFMVLNADVTEVLYATFLGGTESLTHVDGGTSRFDKNGIVYHAVCSGCDSDQQGPKSDFPTTPNAWSRTNNSIDNCNNAAFKFDLSSLKARIQTNSVTFADPGMTIVCIPDKIVFENFSIGGEIFQWDLGDGTKITKEDRNPVIHAYQSKGQYVVKLKAIDQGTCQVMDSTQVTVTVNQAASVVQDDDEVCSGDDYELKALGGVFYQWSTLEDGIFSNSATPRVEPTDTTTYFATIQEANGCVRHDSVVLNLIPAIAPKFSYERVMDCLGRPSLRLTNLTDSAGAGDMLFFEFGDGETSDLPIAEHQFAGDGVYNVKLIANRHACLYESSNQIPVFKLTIPNIITPGNSEGLNDRLTIQFGEQPGVTPSDYGFNVSLIIYNRWGRILLEEDNYQYDWTGEGLAAGIYFYDVTIQDHGTCKSWIQLVK